jgi:hypothetical protein
MQASEQKSTDVHNETQHITSIFGSLTNLQLKFA